MMTTMMMMSADVNVNGKNYAFRSYYPGPQHSTLRKPPVSYSHISGPLDSMTPSEYAHAFTVTGVSTPTSPSRPCKPCGSGGETRASNSPYSEDTTGVGTGVQDEVSLLIDTQNDSTKGLRASLDG